MISFWQIRQIERRKKRTTLLRLRMLFKNSLSTVELWRERSKYQCRHRKMHNAFSAQINLEWDINFQFNSILVLWHNSFSKYLYKVYEYFSVFIILFLDCRKYRKYMNERTWTIFLPPLRKRTYYWRYILPSKVEFPSIYNYSKSKISLSFPNINQPMCH